MSKFYGPVGYATTKEVTPGVWAEVIVERNYSGDLLQNNRRLQTTDKINDDITISNRISILADPYAYQNFHEIRYVTWKGVKWKVSAIDVQYPRLILDLNGLYTEQTEGG